MSQFDIARECAPDAPTAWFVECGQHNYRVLALDEEEYLKAATILTDPEDDDDEITTVGLCNRITSTIYLRLAYKGEALTLSRLRENLLHEVMHVAYGQAGLRWGNVNEEMAVSAITPSLHDVLVRNPWLIDALGLKGREPINFYAPSSVEAPTYKIRIVEAERPD